MAIPVRTGSERLLHLVRDEPGLDQSQVATRLGRSRKYVRQLTAMLSQTGKITLTRENGRILHYAMGQTATNADLPSQTTELPCG